MARKCGRQGEESAAEHRRLYGFGRAPDPRPHVPHDRAGGLVEMGDIRDALDRAAIDRTLLEEVIAETAEAYGSLRLDG